MRRFGPALLLALTPACVVQKSVGDDPETAGVEGPGDPTETSTSGSGSSSASATSQGGTGTATPSYAECGVTVVPIVPGGPEYTDILECEGGCTITIRSGAPTGFNGDPAIGDCLCQSIDCGGWTGNSSGGGEGPVPDGDTTTTGAQSCDFDPPTYEGPGEYAAQCACDTCNLRFEDISPDDANTLIEDPSICECLCEQAGCGGLGVSVGEVGEDGGSSETGVPDTDTASTSG